MTEEIARYGWESDFERFSRVPARSVRESLQKFIPDASIEQIRAWDSTISPLQREVYECLNKTKTAAKYDAILEYELPLESRRTDAIFLISGSVIILEFKGEIRPFQADIDQAAAYGRDLKCYHRECWELPVHVLLVPTRAKGYLGQVSNVHIAGLDHIDEFVFRLDKPATCTPIPKSKFLSVNAYCPLPSLVQAARELMRSGTIRAIHRARSATDPAINEITRIIHEAAKTKSRRLILLTGVPGSGKTLVGLQIVHAHFLDDLAIPRGDGKPTAPAVFLSGNGPLVEVLQYELRSAGGGGRVFVRGVKDYVKRYSSSRNNIPPQHVLVFDEAQRAFDAEEVQERHQTTPGFQGGKSEPEHFIEFAERVPEWCVVIGLIGSGQEIHIGEEAGLGQWRHAVEGADKPGDWIVYGPPELGNIMHGSPVPFKSHTALSLNTEIRFHAAGDLHDYVSLLLNGNNSKACSELASKLENDSYHLRITRDLIAARSYLKKRYAENPDARYGIVASSKDKDLVNHGILNDFQSTKRVRFGPWYSDNEDDKDQRSCRHLRDCVTEFGAQGLELDAVLLAWGTDFRMIDGQWSNERSRGYRRRQRIKDAMQLRINSYRVLLTRGRDATVVFVPPIDLLDETYSYLCRSGFKVLEI